MKHVLTSAGLLALGAATLHAYDPEMTRQLSGRPWTVAATVRGFYDDNVSTAPDRQKEESFGLELSPSAHVNLPFEQTFISLGYIYSLRWYEDRDPHETDQSHQFNAKLRHQFNPRHSLSVNEAFILTSEPTIADEGGIITAPTRTRTESDILHNRASIDYTASLSQRIALSLGYANDWYDYEQENEPALGMFGSRSALLDRLQHQFRIDGRYQIDPSLVGLIGYTLSLTEFTGDEIIALNDATGRPLVPPLMSDDRDSVSHYAYVGADYDLTAKLRASARVGAQFTSYEIGDSTANPYADASASYVYLPGSSVTLGVRHDRNATDISTPDSDGTPTLDAESTLIYAQVVHRITEKLSGSLLGQYQTSTFSDGTYDDESEDLFLVGVNLNYRFNRHFSAEVGYNYDLLESDIRALDGLGRPIGPEIRSYDRNRAYIGFRATY